MKTTNEFEVRAARNTVRFPYRQMATVGGVVIAKIDADACGGARVTVERDGVWVQAFWGSKAAALEFVRVLAVAGIPEATVAANAVWDAQIAEAAARVEVLRARELAWLEERRRAAYRAKLARLDPVERESQEALDAENERNTAAWALGGGS
jgi:hypothetical protein